MKILIHSHAWYPSVGGIERTTDRLASYWEERGNEVVILTRTPACESGVAVQPDQAHTVVRCPRPGEQLRWLNWADVVWQNHFSAYFARGLLLRAKPCVVTVQTWLTENPGWRRRLKRFWLNRHHPVAISRAVRDHVGANCPVIFNPVPGVPKPLKPWSGRGGKVLFVGRLVPDKGGDVLLEAFGKVRRGRDDWHLTIIGDGPMRTEMEKRARVHGDAVSFTGALDESGVRSAMDAHDILVVPSRWDEPLGIVAIEGLYSGMRVLATDGGGLRDLAEFGVKLFPKGDVAALTEQLSSAADVEWEIAPPDKLAATFGVESVGEIYLDLMSSLCC